MYKLLTYHSLSICLSIYYRSIIRSLWHFLTCYDIYYNREHTLRHLQDAILLEGNFFYLGILVTNL